VRPLARDAPGLPLSAEGADLVRVVDELWQSLP
jgi:hypothetical protein